MKDFSPVSLCWGTIPFQVMFDSYYSKATVTKVELHCIFFSTEYLLQYVVAYFLKHKTDLPVSTLYAHPSTHTQSKYASSHFQKAHIFCCQFFFGGSNR